MIGSCGMTANQAGWVSLREFDIRRNARFEKDKEEWERARWQMFLAMQLSPYIKKHQKPKTPQGWIPFAWERVKEMNVEDVTVTDIQVQELNKILQSFINKRKN